MTRPIPTTYVWHGPNNKTQHFFFPTGNNLHALPAGRSDFLLSRFLGPLRPPAANFSTHFFLSSFWLDKRFISIIGTTFMVLLHFIWGQNIPFQPKLWLFKKARSAHFFRWFSVWRDGIFYFFWFYVVCYGVSGCNTCFAMSYGWQLGVYHDDALLLCAKEFNSSMLCHSSKLWKIF